MLTLLPAGDFAAALHHLLAVILGPAPDEASPMGGRDMAIAGLVLGYVFVGPMALFTILGGIGTVAGRVYVEEDEFDRTLAGGQGWLGGR